jgi:hypothetical protein
LQKEKRMLISWSRTGGPPQNSEKGTHTISRCHARRDRAGIVAVEYRPWWYNIPTPTRRAGDCNGEESR